MKKNIKYVVVVIVGIGLLFLSTLFFYHKPTLLEKIIKDGGLFINNLLAFPIKNEENIRCDYYNQELENQITELKKVVNINSVLSEYELINAVVISHDVGYWYDTIIINKGMNDNIQEGMAVVNNSGVIGKVISVTNFSSTVMLLTSENIGKVSVKIENDEDYLYGLISRYNSDTNTYIIEGISQNVELGATVLTTGYSDIFPSGILVGEIISSKSDNYDLAKTLEIKPSVDFNNLNIVSVLKRNVDK